MLSKLLFLILLTVPASALYAQPKPAVSPSPAPTEAALKKPPIFRPTKDQIREVQLSLKERKTYEGLATGTYNDETRAAIKTFQKGNGLKETGTLNRATLEKLGIELTDNQKLIPVSPNSFASAEKSNMSAEKMEPKPTIFRATADQIKAAQKTLKEKKQYAGEETGKLDDATRAGLRRFQESVNIKVTGTLNRITLEAMKIPLTEKQKLIPVVSDDPTPKKSIF